MREFSFVQDIDAPVDTHWRTYFDPVFEAAVMQGLGMHVYEVLGRSETPTEIRRKCHAVPKLDISARIAKLVGASFGYIEDGVFDKRAQVWRTRGRPDALSERASWEMVLRAEPGATPGTCRRTFEYKLEVRVPVLGGMMESAFENNIRAGWAQSVVFLNDWLRKQRETGGTAS